ncbi:hypothetical protein CAPTEDRAFT_155274 [Capitella teleta]|uniref:Phosphatidylinositol 3-kinase catalytic subunit type 3 n=1 Tax=Capitella teleta TaxID=283909 RepID=R7UFF2_CAPTE|nr:hypothetical protein CAPTEDRAFT_155274 [Capitella teleta]|eukprot:ELU04838.1 hypothetical protein CAPTEDRAFT_155274 [Capitella teleta]
MDAPDKFHYVYSCDLEANVQIKIGTLEGHRERPGYKELIDDPLLRFSGACQEGCSDLYVTSQVYAEGRPLALPIRTSYKAFTTRWNWNEWITLPVKFCDLPRSSQLVLTVWDIYGPCGVKPVGGTTISLFGKHGVLRQGMHDLRVWKDVEGDGSVVTTTPGKASRMQDQMSRLAKLSRKHRDGHLPKVDWLDRLTFREIHQITEKHKRESNFLYLMIEFPRVHYDNLDYSIVYFEKGGDEVYQMRTQADIVTIPDPEIEQENLVESKHHKLARSVRSGPSHTHLKPNAATRDLLNMIVSYSPTKTLTSEEKDLIWKFRFYLSNQKKALPKFLRSVNWNMAHEEKQALELLTRWSPMNVEDSLELLAPSFTHPAVRSYAVARLQQASDQDLMLYLLQLVQALRYEDFAQITEHYERERRIPVMSTTSLQGSMMTSHAEAEHPLVQSDEDAPQLQESVSASDTLQDALKDPSYMDLISFLIQRACNNSTLANYFCWYLRVECDDQEVQTKDPRVVNMYITVLKRFSHALNTGGEECRRRRAAIAGQQVFMDRLIRLAKMVARESGNRKRKIERLQAFLSDPELLRFNFTCFDPIPLPLDPEFKVEGIIAEKATLFKSNLMPCKFHFRTSTGEEYITIYKHGDDLRQDQLVLQIITLMDRLLRIENLDLKITPYKVLATSSRDGFIQFIDSRAIADIQANDGSIQNYLRKHMPAEGGPYGIAQECIDNYIKSCAGYSVITYILGVGDRHLDNILIAPNGCLFHVDFGYILGRDPKPMPPPMRLSREMIEAMGGVGSEHFADFKQHSYTAFLHLRRHANLILHLFSLMVDANVPDIALEPDKTVKKVQDKFRLDLTDEEAVQYMQTIIDASASATVAALMEQMHKIAQYWRK